MTLGKKPGEERLPMKTILLIATLLLAIPALAESPADVPAFGSSMASMCYLDREASVALTAGVLTEPGTIAGFRFAETTAVLRVEQAEEGRYAIRLGDSEVERGFRADYDEFAVFTLDVDADGRDEVFVESGQGRGTSVYQRRLAVYQVDDGHFKTIFETVLNDYFTIPGEAFPGGWIKRYRLLRDGESKPVEIMLVLETPEVPVATPDADAQIAMSRREMRFRLDEDGVYGLIGEK